MARAMNPEQTSYEHFDQDPTQLRDRFRFGMLQELQGLPQWVVWRGEIEDGKPKKVPYNPNYAHMYPMQPRASAKLQKSWGSLQEALTALETGLYSGIGFMLKPPLVMIDLDHSYDKATQTITDPQAQEIVEALNSYTETSPRGIGLHVLAYGQLPASVHKEIEMYGQDRFTTITTNHLAGTPATIKQRQEAIDARYQRFAPPVEEREKQNTSGGGLARKRIDRTSKGSKR